MLIMAGKHGHDIDPLVLQNFLLGELANEKPYFWAAWRALKPAADAIPIRAAPPTLATTGKKVALA